MDEYEESAPDIPVEIPEPVPTDTPAAPSETQKPAAPAAPSGDTTFAFINGETTAQEMMDRINAAAPPYCEGYLANGKPITEANIQEMLAIMEQSMPTGTKWNGDDAYSYSGDVVGGSACAGFAFAVSDAIFGENAPLNKHQNFTELKVGDAFEMSDGNTYTHFVVVMTQPDEDGNFLACSGNYGQKVIWSSNKEPYIKNLKDFLEGGSAFATNSWVWSRY